MLDIGCNSGEEQISLFEKMLQDLKAVIESRNGLRPDFDAWLGMVCIFRRIFWAWCWVYLFVFIPWFMCVCEVFSCVVRRNIGFLPRLCFWYSIVPGRLQSSRNSHDHPIKRGLCVCVRFLVAWYGEI